MEKRMETELIPISMEASMKANGKMTSKMVKEPLSPPRAKNIQEFGKRENL
jgi:hypothetical protein